MTVSHDVWTDPELRDLVRSEPELVAIADAVGDALDRQDRRTSRRRQRSRLLAGTIVAAGVAIALAVPWNRSGAGNVVDLALAAVGAQPVIHVVAEMPTDAQLVDVRTGDGRPVYETTEIWYYRGERLKRSVVRVGGQVVDDSLETPQGSFSPQGVVFDCAWIAAHPAAATNAGVTCNASGGNAEPPTVVSRPDPTLDPRLADFVDGYRQALASGRARAAGNGEVDGQAVDWLVFETAGRSERVALDRHTHKPVLLKSASGDSIRIALIETIPYAGPDFRRPEADDIRAQPLTGSAADGMTLPLEGAAIVSAVPHTVWPGQSIAGMQLVSANRQLLGATFASGPPLSGSGLELGYGSVARDGHLDSSRPYVLIQEAPSRDLAYAHRWSVVSGEAPKPGELYASMANPRRRNAGTTGDEIAGSPQVAFGFTVIHGTYVTIQAPNMDLVLQAARSLGISGP